MSCQTGDVSLLIDLSLDFFAHDDDDDDVTMMVMVMVFVSTQVALLLFFKMLETDEYTACKARAVNRMDPALGVDSGNGSGPKSYPRDAHRTKGKKQGGRERGEENPDRRISHREAVAAWTLQIQTIELEMNRLSKQVCLLPALLDHCPTDAADDDVLVTMQVPSSI